MLKSKSVCTLNISYKKDIIRLLKKNHSLDNIKKIPLEKQDITILTYDSFDNYYNVDNIGKCIIKIFDHNDNIVLEDDLDLKK